MHGLRFCQAMRFHGDKFAAFCVSCNPRKLCFRTSECDPTKSDQGFQKKRLFGFGALHHHKPVLRLVAICSHLWLFN